ncbi:MAG: AAA family ATPase [Rhodopseudomonas palustris]|nr:AAA family ATPase [Rhodopseudomonas palustris]
MLMEPSDILVLDEPTNHLDMKLQDAMEYALNGFDGTLLVVSYDRSFLDDVVTEVLIPEDGKGLFFQGSVSEYFDSRKEEAQSDASSISSVSSVLTRTRVDRGVPSVSKNELLRAKNRLDRVEREIEELEEEKAKRTDTLSDLEIYRDPIAFGTHGEAFPGRNEADGTDGRMGEVVAAMFVIKRLRIHGFKSFPLETDIDFSPGITAMVGPNGSGKSNVADALLWVMGEQSVKSLRGDQMEDVIFNGSERLAPMGMTEVELKLERIDPAPGEERLMSIERRFYRSGEGEYRLNGKRVRRKDIQDFLLTIGMGSRSYSIMEQGKISTILNSKPEDRRLLIEEAAGILKYKTKKKEAEGKIRLDPRKS